MYKEDTEMINTQRQLAPQYEIKLWYKCCLQWRHNYRNVFAKSKKISPVVLLQSVQDNSIKVGVAPKKLPQNVYLIRP